MKLIADAQAAKLHITKSVAMERIRQSIAISMAKNQAYAIQTRAHASGVLLSSRPQVVKFNNVIM